MRRPCCAGFAVFFLAAVLAGCNTGREAGAYVERPVENLYNEAMDNLIDGLYDVAALTFDEVERQHPYSMWATRAQLMTAFSHYQANNFDDAIIAARRYIQLHPGSPDVPYAYYIIGVSYYEQIVDVGRDQRLTELALGGLDELIRRFPDSEYARDARLKMDLTRDHLAGKEMEIGRFYQRRGKWLAATIRFRTVIEKYETTTHTPEALMRLTESYLALGVPVEAKKTAAVLGANYPGSKWYERAYELVNKHGAT